MEGKKLKSLIVYATKHGATAKCASILSKKLSGEVNFHDLNIGSVPNLTQYDRVIIGGSIYTGRIQKEVGEFCSQYLDILKNKKLGLFICCMFKNNAEAHLSSAFPQEILKSAAARENFGGEMRFSNMSFGEKMITRMVSKLIAKENPDLSAIDVKKDVSFIFEENIDKFAKQMNNI
jgi:menaquinone-dependent protoporphyrinogen oxidase